LIDAGAEVNQTGVGKYGNALTAAVMKNSIDAVKLLLEHGADANISAGKGYDHQHALHAACLQYGELEEPELVKVLVEAGVDVNRQGGKYWTPL
jgi:ankyrin repeat protein